MKKLLILLFLLNLLTGNSHSIEPDVFVQSTVNRASEILSKDISKEEKINQLKVIAKETVDIRGVGFYSLGSARKNLNESEKVITTCGSGVSACVIALSYYRIGNEDIPVYDGSWSEWASKNMKINKL